MNIEYTDMTHIYIYYIQNIQTWRTDGRTNRRTEGWTEPHECMTAVAQPHICRPQWNNLHPNILSNWLSEFLCIRVTAARQSPFCLFVKKVKFKFFFVFWNQIWYDMIYKLHSLFFPINDRPVSKGWQDQCRESRPYHSHFSVFCCCFCCLVLFAPLFVSVCSLHCTPSITWPIYYRHIYKMWNNFACVRLMASWCWTVWIIRLSMCVKSPALCTDTIWITSSVMCSSFCLMVQRCRHTVSFCLL